jgi:DNA-binding transcriptional MerR regulator
MKPLHINSGDAGAGMSGAQDNVTKAVNGDDFTIGDLAREFDVTLRALRFYESRGLLKPRRHGLTRFYDAECRARLALILKGKALGFTLQEIRDMLAEKTRQGDSSNRLNLNLAQVDEQLETLRQQRSEIEQAITELEQTRARLMA